MRNNNKYVLRGLQCLMWKYKIIEMMNSNKYVLRGLQNVFNVEVQDNCEINMFYVDFRMRLMWKYKIIVR